MLDEYQQEARDPMTYILQMVGIEKAEAVRRDIVRAAERTNTSFYDVAHALLDALRMIEERGRPA